MTLQEYAESVALRSVKFNDAVTDGYGVIDIALIIGLVLPILSNLPCFKPKSAAEKRQFVEDRPTLAIRQTMQEVKRQAKGTGEKVVRSEARSIAETIISDYLDTPDETIMAMGLSL